MILADLERCSRPFHRHIALWLLRKLVRGGLVWCGVMCSLVLLTRSLLPEGVAIGQQRSRPGLVLHDAHGSRCVLVNQQGRAHSRRMDWIGDALSRGFVLSSVRSLYALFRVFALSMISLVRFTISFVRSMISFVRIVSCKNAPHWCIRFSYVFLTAAMHVRSPRY